jgi:hypothetical protein
LDRVPRALLHFNSENFLICNFFFFWSVNLKAGEARGHSIHSIEYIN